MIPTTMSMTRHVILKFEDAGFDQMCLHLMVSFQVSQGLTALTFWVLVHFLFIFGAIIVYGVQLTLIRFSKEKYNQPEEEKDPEKRARIIDKRMLLLFFSLYLLFNILYWPVCLFGQR